MRPFASGTRVGVLLLGARFTVRPLSLYKVQIVIYTTRDIIQGIIKHRSAIHNIRARVIIRVKVLRATIHQFYDFWFINNNDILGINGFNRINWINWIYRVNRVNWIYRIYRVNRINRINRINRFYRLWLNRLWFNWFCRCLRVTDRCSHFLLALLLYGYFFRLFFRLNVIFFFDRIAYYLSGKSASNTTYGCRCSKGCCAFLILLIHSLSYLLNSLL